MAIKDPKKETPEDKVEEVVEEKEVVEETPEETPEVKEETPEVDEKEVETSDDTKEDEDVKETKKEVKEEEFDVEEFKKTTIEETKKAVAEDIAKSLGVTKEDEVKLKEEGLVPPWETRGEVKPKSWKEHAEYSADLAEWKREQREVEIAKTQEDNEKEAKDVNKKWNDYWDSELKELEGSNKIPKVKDEKDPNDPGKKARIKLFAKMQEIGLKRQTDGLAPITSIKLVYYEHYEDDEPPGANAPVSFGKKGVMSDDSDDYSYEEIHGKSFDKLKGTK